MFKHLVHRDAEYKDARARYRHAKTHLLAQAGISPGHGAGSSFGEGASSLPASVQETLPRQKASGAFAHYELKHELGKGAMGVVYQGETCAQAEWWRSKPWPCTRSLRGCAGGCPRTFFKEAEAAGRLEHPNIVTIDGSGKRRARLHRDGVRGRHGPDRFHSNPHLLPVAQVLAIGARVRCPGLCPCAPCRASRCQTREHHVGPCHRHGEGDGFWVARITDASKTRTGIVLGTPSFMSPEQLCGAKVDGRTDLYALV